MDIKFRFLARLCLAATLTIGSASAQINGILGVTLPQSFTVQGVKLPAGQYSIHELSGSGANSVLLLRSASGINTSVIVEPITHAQQTTATESSITLRKVDGQLQLDQIWVAGSDVGFRILPSTK